MPKNLQQKWWWKIRRTKISIAIGKRSLTYENDKKIALDHIPRNYQKIFEHKWIASSYRRISHDISKVVLLPAIGDTPTRIASSDFYTDAYIRRQYSRRENVRLSSLPMLLLGSVTQWRELTPRIHSDSQLLFVVLADYSRICCNLPLLFSHSSALMATAFQRPGRSSFKRIIYCIMGLPSQ